MNGSAEALERNWWAVGLRGLVALAIGLVALLRPSLPFVALVALFGAWWLVDGILAIVASVYASERRMRSWPLVAEGVTGIVLGAALYFIPGITAQGLLLFVAGWAIVSGGFRVLGAFGLRNEIQGDWALVSSGVISALFGLLTALSPGTSAIVLVISTGLFALLFGAMQLVACARLHGFHRRHTAHPVGM